MLKGELYSAVKDNRETVPVQRAPPVQEGQRYPTMPASSKPPLLHQRVLSPRDGRGRNMDKKMDSIMAAI